MGNGNRHIQIESLKNEQASRDWKLNNMLLLRKLSHNIKKINIFLRLKNQIYLDPSLKEIWKGKDLFNQIFNTQGQLYRHVENRKTLRFSVNNNSYFLKLHKGIGWKGIFKSLRKFRRLTLGAKREWKAILHLEQLNIPTTNLVGYGQKGWNPARLNSFLITKELTGMISINDLCAKLGNDSPSLKFKRKLIQKVANFTRLLHENGINHRDFCICHLYLPLQANHDDIQLYLIDLHKTRIKKRISLPRVINDIVSLNLSSLPLELNRKDFFCFIKNYTQKTLSLSLKEDQELWRKINEITDRKAKRLQKNTVKHKILCYWHRYIPIMDSTK